ncbi:MAG: hypothetical protein K8T20_00830, partial [Planctomycetes bacterium]|nr:hypothetical protein [Planctomycetota bacterium]
GLFPGEAVSIAEGYRSLALSRMRATPPKRTAAAPGTSDPRPGGSPPAQADPLATSMKYEEQNAMSRRVKIESFVWLAALFALTGGFGLFVPRILGLGNCGDYWGGSVLWILFFTLVLVISAGLAAVAGERRIGGWLLRACAWRLSLVV